MKASVFLQAAELIETRQEEFACCAIDQAAGYGPRLDFSPERHWFNETFRPHDQNESRGHSRAAWLAKLDEPVAASIHRRVVALCLAAAIIKADNR